MVEAAPLSAPVPKGPKKKQENVKKFQRTIWSIKNFSKCWPGYMWLVFVCFARTAWGTRPAPRCTIRIYFKNEPGTWLLGNLQIENNPNNKIFFNKPKWKQSSPHIHMGHTVYGWYAGIGGEVRESPSPPWTGPHRGGVNTGGSTRPLLIPLTIRRGQLLPAPSLPATCTLLCINLGFPMFDLRIFAWAWQSHYHTRRILTYSRRIITHTIFSHIIPNLIFSRDIH